MRRRGRATSTSSVATTRAGARRQDEHAVGEHDRLLDVVRHEHDGARRDRERAGQPVLHLLARERVERGERLVEAEHRAARQQRARERDALAHPARQLVRARALEAVEAEVAQQRGRLLARALALDARDAQRERGVVDGAAPGQQQVALGHERRGRRVDRARVGLDQPADELEQRRLAAAARADDGDDLARRARASDRPSSAVTGVGAAPGWRERLARRRAARPSRVRSATSAGASSGARIRVSIAPSAGITPQVRRVSAARGRYLSRPVASPPGLRLRRKPTSCGRPPAGAAPCSSSSGRRCRACLASL